MFVFRFLRLQGQAPLPDELVKLHPRNQTKFEAASQAVREVALERNSEDEFDVAPTTGRTARREEGILAKQFDDHLKAQGHKLFRFRVQIPGDRTVLVTDTFDATENTLWEIKADNRRADIRYGIGQVLDYRRLIERERGPIEVGIVLPAKPSESLCDLAFSLGLRLAYPEGESWGIHES